MTTIGLYFRGLDKDQTNALVHRLNTLAASHGYIAHAGPTAGQGNLAAMLQAIDGGEVAVVLLPDEQRGIAIRWLREQAGVAGGSLGEALLTLAQSLDEAAERAAEAEQGEIEDNQ